MSTETSSPSGPLGRSVTSTDKSLTARLGSWCSDRKSRFKHWRHIRDVREAFEDRRKGPGYSFYGPRERMRNGCQSIGIGIDPDTHKISMFANYTRANKTSNYYTSLDACNAETREWLHKSLVSETSAIQQAMLKGADRARQRYIESKQLSHLDTYPLDESDTEIRDARLAGAAAAVSAFLTTTTNLPARSAVDLVPCDSYLIKEMRDHPYAMGCTPIEYASADGPIVCSTRPEGTIQPPTQATL